MKKYDHVRQKAIELRHKRYSLDQISSMLSIPKTTVFYWIKGMEEKPVFQPIMNSLFRAKAVSAMVAKYKKLRDDAYSSALASAENDLQDRKLRDFVCLYMGEGGKCSRNYVSFINSDPELVCMAHGFMLKLSNRKIDYTLHLYPDHVEEEEVSFWSLLLGIDPNRIKTRPKPGSNKLKRRNTRLKHGIFIVGTGDTYLMSRINAYTDYIKKQWQ